MTKNIFKSPLLAGIVLVIGIFLSACEKDAQYREFNYPAPVVKDFSPKQGYAMSNIIIDGQDFGEVAGAVKVYFGNVRADTIRSVTNNKIVVQAPAKGVTGVITVEIFGKRDSLPQVFTFKPAARLISMSKDKAQAGDEITLTGNNFGTDKSLVHVFIGIREAEVVSITTDQVKFKVPDVPSGSVTLIVDGQHLIGQYLLIGVEKLTGTLFGHSGSWSNNPATMIAAAVDGNLNTYVDGATATGYVGYDLGEGKPAILKSVRYAPRNGNAARMVGGQIRGANDPSLSDYVVLHTIATAPPNGVYTEAQIATTNSYRYIYYYSPAGYCNISEIEFYGSY
ncbi:IPT/TIG domain-containing protein [Chitinophaga sp. 22321]|uniref:IPT/TIG domain-containing protein n=1 Tax=Chitinophaga hostae TaxID=2831022 RepID=A0ABS5J5P5_9BACT|nr:IPT/TIG domain-containing protein [Chitinophaga hostae]MBS0030534.1 IPT/TIG domain-containing protein [Chitinophaga hostae]